jgi:hypothetical protein
VLDTLPAASSLQGTFEVGRIGGDDHAQGVNSTSVGVPLGLGQSSIEPYGEIRARGTFDGRLVQEVKSSALGHSSRSTEKPRKARDP